MTDKEYSERFVFEKVSRIFIDFPGGTVEKSESHDVLIRNETESFGVEICKIVNEKEPGEKFSPSESVNQ